MKRGGQTGNQNARRKHTRLAVSFSGVSLDLAYAWLAELGETQPTPTRVKEFIIEKFVIPGGSRETEEARASTDSNVKQSLT